MAHDADGRQLQVPTSQATAPTRRKSELSLLDAPEILERKSIQSDAKANLSSDERLSNNGRPGSALSGLTSSHAPAAIAPPVPNPGPRDLNAVRTIPGMAYATPPPPFSRLWLHWLSVNLFLQLGYDLCRRHVGKKKIPMPPRTFFLHIRTPRPLHITITRPLASQEDRPKDVTKHDRHRRSVDRDGGLLPNPTITHRPRTWRAHLFPSNGSRKTLEIIRSRGRDVKKATLKKEAEPWPLVGDTNFGLSDSKIPFYRVPWFPS